MSQEKCCDDDDMIDGRFMDAVNEYASTCDYCGEPTMHEAFAFFDIRSQLGACELCVSKYGLEAIQRWASQPADGTDCPTFERREGE